MFGPRQPKAPAEGPFYKQRGWLNAVAFLSFLLVMSLVALVNDTDGPDPAADSRQALAGLSGPLSPGDPQRVRNGAGGRPENCRTDDRDTARPTTPPTEVRWRKIESAMVPTSPSAGPLHIDSGTWWCFARTPMGAVLAAHIIPVRLGSVDWRTVAEQQVVPGTPRDRFVMNRAVEDNASPDEGTVQVFKGFSLASYSHDSAKVELLLANPLGGYLSTSVSVRWRDGDWKVLPRDDGSVTSSVNLASPDRFVFWGA